MATHRRGPKLPLDHAPEAVTYARKVAGLTQAQLAELVGISAGHMSEIESGKRNAQPELITRLADALKCPRVVLVGLAQKQDAA